MTKHDEDELERLSEIQFRHPRPSPALFRSAMKAYAISQAAPLEARILALEKALKDSHHYHVINARRYDATNSPLGFNEAMNIVHAPVEPHPLLAQKELKQ